MKDLILYLVKSELSLLIFLLPYFFWLRKQKNFGLGRIWLLLSLAVSSVFPLLEGLETISQIPVFQLRILPEVVVGNAALTATDSAYPLSSMVFWTIYLGGAAIAAVFLFREVFGILKLTSGAHNVEKDVYVLNQAGKRAFTFMNRVYLSEDISACDYAKIVAHERVHAKEKHSYDLLLTRLLHLLHWYSPLYRWYLQLLKENHEFSADAGALEKEQNADEYAEVLVRMATSRHTKLAHSFHSKESIKNRLTMMYNNAGPAGIKKLAMIMFPFAIAAFLIACSETEAETATENEVENTERTASIPDSEASFPGGQEALITWMQAEMIYPEDAKAKGLEGKVMVKFQISAEGKVTAAEVVRGADEVLNNAALETVKKMPDFIPAVKGGQAVASELVLPIVFSLAGE
jgi:TonB family protein